MVAKASHVVQKVNGKLQKLPYVCAHALPESAYQITGKSKTAWGPTDNAVCGRKLARSAEKFTK